MGKTNKSSCAARSKRSKSAATRSTANIRLNLSSSTFGVVAKLLLQTRKSLNLNQPLKEYMKSLFDGINETSKHQFSVQLMITLLICNRRVCIKMDAQKFALRDDRNKKRFIIISAKGMLKMLLKFEF
jgi:hypothetical protein